MPGRVEPDAHIPLRLVLVQLCSQAGGKLHVGRQAGHLEGDMQHDLLVP